MTNESWGEVCAALRRRVGKNSFDRWIEPLRYLETREGVAHFAVPTTFFGTWVHKNFADQIRQQMAETGIAVERLEFSVPGAGAAA
jgi:chromosomal replication initiator protein